MELEQVKGNTWVLKSWELIPLYKVDDSHCVLLDTGTYDQRDELEEALKAAGLIPVGILGSHAHIDHMGSYGYLQEEYGAQLALSLGEAGQLFSPLALHLEYYNLPVESFPEYPELHGVTCLADRIILPQEDHIEFCGAEFDIIHTPGHTVDHICVRTPDNVLYLGDAVMTGRTLHQSKFPYTYDMKEYLHSLGALRLEQADQYIVAHQGVYQELLPLIDLELRFLTERMRELLELVDGSTTPKEMTASICQNYHILPRGLRDLAYYELASQTYIHYLCGLGMLEPYIAGVQIRYRRTQASFHKKGKAKLPRTGLFR